MSPSWTAALFLASGALWLHSCDGLHQEPYTCDEYSPVGADCPEEPFVRSDVGGGIFPEERDWLAKRAVVTAPAWSDYIASLSQSLPDVDLSAALSSPAPRLGFAASGGGLRATLNSAGVSSSFDVRERKVVPPPLQGGYPPTAVGEEC